MGWAKTSLYLEDATSWYGGASTKPSRVISGADTCVQYVLPDARVFNDVRLRRALAYAWPYRTQWRDLDLIDGKNAFAGSSILPPATPGRLAFRPLESDPGSTDAARSRQLLKATGYRPGQLHVTYPYLAGFPPTDRFWGRDLVAALRRGGFNATPLAVFDPNRLFKMLADPQAPINLRYLDLVRRLPLGDGLFQQLFGPGLNGISPFFHNSRRRRRDQQNRDDTEPRPASRMGTARQAGADELPPRLRHQIRRRRHAARYPRRRRPLRRPVCNPDAQGHLRAAAVT